MDVCLTETFVLEPGESMDVTSKLLFEIPRDICLRLSTAKNMRSKGIEVEAALTSVEDVGALRYVVMNTNTRTKVRVLVSACTRNTRTARDKYRFVTGRRTARRPSRMEKSPREVHP